MQLLVRAKLLVYFCTYFFVENLIWNLYKTCYVMKRSLAKGAMNLLKNFFCHQRDLNPEHLASKHQC